MGDIAVLLMVKNEESNIRTTLESVRDFPAVLVYDTGSTDNTAAVAAEYPNVRLFEGTFGDFATSRNAMHEIAERELEQEYFLLMDAGDVLVKTADIPSLDRDVYLIKQVWHNTDTTCFYNTRLIRKSSAFRYKGKVHEYLVITGRRVSIMDSFHLYQDRSQSASSSVARWERDMVTLEKEVGDSEEPDPRDVFYLAQTYECLRIKDKAYETYRSRSRMANGFYEERFISMLRCGDLARTWDKRISWYIKSFDLINRAEPLVKIAGHYLADRRFWEAWMFAKMACELQYPSQCVLFVDVETYSYKRWHLLGIAGFYAGKHEDGKRGCEMAIEAKKLPVDLANLKFYET